MMKRQFLLVCIFVFGSAAGLAPAVGKRPRGNTFTNSLGMKFVRIEPGTFRMGQLKKLEPEVLPLIEGGDRGGRFDLLDNGDYDERPVHTVTITKPFYMAACEVTNFQYELFDPSHKRKRGIDKVSVDDDEPVIYVNWYNAQAFCQWLSDIEGLPYRLPTEAEWEYACRAGTATNYYTGDILPREFQKQPGRVRMPGARPLQVGKTTPNAWGLYDMHGNIEELCNDWYGPYKKGRQVDPVGYAQGDFRVTRGGSYATSPYFLRSANRMGALPEDKHWLIGFRVVIGELPKTRPLPPPKPALYQQNVIARDRAEVSRGPDRNKPYFSGPRRFMNIPPASIGPVFAGHNHNPAIVECPNGDLLTIWYTCVSEKDRELGQAASRLRYGTDQWEQASPFWDVPDRNDHCPTLWFDGTSKIYHFCGVSAGATYGTLAMIMRSSADSGATWSRARIIVPGHANARGGHMDSEPVFRMNDGAIAIVTDGFPTLWTSPDEGLSWHSCGGTLIGNHPGVTQLADGRLIGFVRDHELEAKEVITTYQDMGRTLTHKARNRRMKKSISADGGKTWTQTASVFPCIYGGQRLVLLRLKEGPLFLASFANRGIIITDAAGQKREVRGMFGAVSEDGGETWPYIRLISDGSGRAVETTNGGFFTMGDRTAEYRGYMSGCQGLDGVIHLISSYEHYSFNLAWLKTPQPPARRIVPVMPAVETFTGPDFDAKGWQPYHGHSGGFNGKGQYTILSKSHFQGMNRIIGAGSFEMNMAFKNIHFNPRGPTASPGITIWIKDAMMRRLHFYVRDNRLSLGLQDEEDRVPFPEGRNYNVYFSVAPKSANLKFIYNEKTRRVRIFYGLNGAEATTELPHSKAGIYFGRALSESAAAYIMMSCGSVDVDHCEIKPLPD